MLIENTLFGEVDKVKKAIERIRAFEPKDGYYLAFSGGKDSQCIYHLAKEAGVKFEAHYHLTTVDPPELVYFIRSNYPDVIIDYPQMSMWQLIAYKKIPPTRLVRYCCSYLKENQGVGRTVITGVRWDESSRRKNSRAVFEINAYSQQKIMLNNDNNEARKILESCQLKGKHILNPIVDWLEEDVWGYLYSRKIKHCCLYDENFHRIGCIGCPMAGTNGMLKEFERYPKYYNAYLRAFDKMLIKRKKSNMPTLWKDANDVMKWWIYGKAKSEININQLSLFD